MPANEKKNSKKGYKKWQKNPGSPILLGPYVHITFGFHVRACKLMGYYISYNVGVHKSMYIHILSV